jgi:endonuclease/exonuclease/phosphatase family metal-dependent hydrolase
MKIMTFNLRYDNETDKAHSWSHRQHSLLAMIQKSEADVISTQETTDTIHAFLHAHCPDYVLVGDGRESTRLGERCSVMIKKDKFRVLKTQTVWLNGNFDLAGDQDEEEGFARICTMVLIQDKATLRKIRIFNCHLAYQSVGAIKRNGENLLKYINRFEHTKIPFVLTGDFNSPIDHPLHGALLGKFHEAYRTLNRPRINTFQAYGDPQGIDAIDFIYTSTLKFTDVITDTTTFNGLYPSDHYPVIAELL